VSAEILVVRCGIVPYEQARAAQQRLQGERQRGEIPDVLLLLEHPPVYYHGPGQLVAYPIVSLRPYGDDVHEYVRRLERVTIAALAEHGVQAGPIEGLTGVWTRGRRAEIPPSSWEIGPPTPGEARKIGSIGVHVSRGVTTHGLAVNVSNDLQPFEWVVPCGIEGCQVSSLSRELGAEQDLAAFADTVAARFGEVYDRLPVATDPADLGLDLPAATLRASP
jgi:lipoyl(octanoyl) transferase